MITKKYAYHIPFLRENKMLDFGVILIINKLIELENHHA